jgi:hypothetical protein
MIRSGFLDPESRRDLIDLGLDGPISYRLAGRANAVVLLDEKPPSRLDGTPTGFGRTR